MVLDAGVEQGPQLLDAPFVERMAEAGTQAPAGQVEPGPFVLGRAAPALGAFHQGVEQSAQQRRLPALARAQQVFERAAQLAYFAALDLLVAGAEDAVDALQGVIQAGGQGGAVLFLFFGVVAGAAQLEFQLPALPAAVFGHAMHGQRADFRQRRRQLHRHFGFRSGRLRAQHGGDGGQAHDVRRIEVDQVAGLRWMTLRQALRVAGGGHQVEAHRPSEAQAEAASGQAHFDARLCAARQQADGAQRACLRGFFEQQEEAARRAAFDRRGQALARQRIRDRAARHGDVGVEVVQHPHGLAAPCGQGVGQALGQRRAAEYAAVQQQRVRHRQAVVAGRCRRRCRGRRAPPAACWRRKPARWRVMAGSLA